MPSTTIHILGLELEIENHYVARHVCTQNEASVLNRALVKGISKGLFKVITAARAEFEAPLSADQSAQVRQRALDFIAEFTEGFALGHERTRAIRLECERIARQLLDSQLNSHGQTRSDVSADELAARLSELAASERVRSEAERRVQVTLEIAAKAHEELSSEG